MEDRSALMPFLKQRHFARHELLERPPSVVNTALFAEEGVVSVLSMYRPGLDAEVAMIGREGMLGLQLLHGMHPAILPAECRLPGWGYEIKGDDLQALLRARPNLRSRLERYLEWRQFQMAMLAMSARQASVEQSLARALLMLHDRSNRDTIFMTHDELARLISARRPGTTLAMHVLEGGLYIRASRGTVVIRDRPGLEEFAGDYYGNAENAWFEMLGKLRPASITASAAE